MMISNMMLVMLSVDAILNILLLLFFIYLMFCLFFFFFQAEDGIRDLTVTGVQTCALPISRASAAARVARLRTHPGVGLQTALAVVHTLEPVTRFDRARRIAAYCGLDPSEHSSGDTTRYGHISKQGNRLLRFLLVEAAWSAVQHEEDLGRFFRRLRARKN